MPAHVRSARVAVGALASLVLSIVTACSGSEFGAANGTTAGGGAKGGGTLDGGDNGGTGSASSGGAAGNVSTGGTSNGGMGAGGGASGGGAGSGGAENGGTTAGSGGSGDGGAPSSTVQLVTAYDRSCTDDSGCVMVPEGDVCGCPLCHNASIASSAQAKWDADRKQIYCPVSGAPIGCPGILCQSLVPACVNQLCVARQQVIIDIASYDTSCRTDSDCRLIYGGEVCSACRCSTAAVNLGAFTEYQKQVSAVQCTPPPVACDCAAQTKFACVGATASALGACTLTGF